MRKFNMRKYNMRDFLKRHWSIVTAILLFAISLILDCCKYIFPGTALPTPSAEACWNMLEAQAGISAVGLTIVSLIISIVNTEVFGMSFPEYIMERTHPPYLRYKFVLKSVIALVVINWGVILCGFYFTSVYIFILTGVLAVFQTSEAMQVIYVRDNMKDEVRKYICDNTNEECEHCIDSNCTECEFELTRFKDLENLYQTASRNIKKGEYVDFCECLELAKDLLLYYIKRWDNPIPKDKDKKDEAEAEEAHLPTFKERFAKEVNEIYPGRYYIPKKDSKNSKTYGDRFNKNLSSLIENAVEADNNRVKAEIVEFYYKALLHANNNYNKVWIEKQCFETIAEIFKSFDFKYLNEFKISRACTYEEFLLEAYDNHFEYLMKLRRAGKCDDDETFFDKDDTRFGMTFFIVHYDKLTFNKDLDIKIYRDLFDAAHSKCFDGIFGTPDDKYGIIYYDYLLLKLRLFNNPRKETLHFINLSYTGLDDKLKNILGEFEGGGMNHITFDDLPDEIFHSAMLFRMFDNPSYYEKWLEDFKDDSVIASKLLKCWCDGMNFWCVTQETLTLFWHHFRKFHSFAVKCDLMESTPQVFICFLFYICMAYTADESLCVGILANVFTGSFLETLISYFDDCEYNEDTDEDGIVQHYMYEKTPEINVASYHRFCDCFDITPIGMGDLPFEEYAEKLFKDVQKKLREYKKNLDNPPPKPEPEPVKAETDSTDGDTANEISDGELTEAERLKIRTE
jgi:hypothetical protein